MSAAKVIERGRFRFRRVVAGKYIAEKRSRQFWFYVGLVSRIRPAIAKKATCWQISGPVIEPTRFGYYTLGEAVAAFARYARDE